MKSGFMFEINDTTHNKNNNIKIEKGLSFDLVGVVINFA